MLGLDVGLNIAGRLPPIDEAGGLGKRGLVLPKIDRGQRRAELGIAIGADHWGRGHARAALGRVLQYGFEDLQLHRLEADVDPDNAASLRLFEALGFQREGLLRQRWFMHGRWCDSVLLGLLQPEWAEYGMR